MNKSDLEKLIIQCENQVLIEYDEVATRNLDELTNSIMGSDDNAIDIARSVSYKREAIEVSSRVTVLLLKKLGLITID